ncbi:MAG: rRNA maturation RNase YbeY [Oscillospiraceae bacterium]|nr:rRNA maturation RNase YbeY [Oscillospiraceae bacterium]
MRQYIETALRTQGVTFSCEINVLVTDDATIRALNQGSRGIDKATDVLSFPMFELTPGELPEDVAALRDPATGLVPLGDMAISLEHARTQAKEYGHSVSREVGYLTVHSVLHLLGYDHVDEGPMKKQMRRREEVILSKLGLTRDTKEETI